MTHNMQATHTVLEYAEAHPGLLYRQRVADATGINAGTVGGVLDRQIANDCPGWEKPGRGVWEYTPPEPEASGDQAAPDAELRLLSYKPHTNGSYAYQGTTTGAVYIVRPLSLYLPVEG